MVIKGKLVLMKFIVDCDPIETVGVVDGDTVEPLAYSFPYDSKVSVRYFTDTRPIESEAEGFMRLDGLLNADFELESYHIRYSEYTSESGIDITEKIMVGGHDLLAEMKSKIGQYLYLIVE